MLYLASLFPTRGVVNLVFGQGPKSAQTSRTSRSEANFYDCKYLWDQFGFDRDFENIARDSRYISVRRFAQNGCSNASKAKQVTQ